MRWFVVESVYDSVRPVTHVLKLFGMWSSGWSPGPSRWKCWHSCLYVAFFMALNGYTTYVTLCVQHYDYIYQSLIIGKMEIIYVMIMYLIIKYSILSCCFLRDKIANMLEQLHQVDVDLLGLKSRVNHERNHWKLVLAIIVMEFSSVALTVGSYFYYEETIPGFNYTVQTYLSYLLPLNFYILNWVMATTMVVLVATRFRTLNDTFRMYFPTTPSCGGFLSSTSHTETVICNEKEQLAVLKQIKILHDKLNDVVELVNYCFSVQITFCVGLCFVIGVVCSFGLFRAFIYRNELFYMGVLNFVWYMYYLFFVLFFIAVGSKITREGKRIGVLVHKAINCASSSAVINELNIFSQQLLHRSPVITCGLFVYDWTLLYTMIGATATYLIILIQFDVSFPNLVNVNGTQTAASGV
ncbi:AAEL007935-PG, partial [Aedes aegypti]